MALWREELSSASAGCHRVWSRRSFMGFLSAALMTPLVGCGPRTPKEASTNIPTHTPEPPARTSTPTEVAASTPTDVPTPTASPAETPAGTPSHVPTRTPTPTPTASGPNLAEDSLMTEVETLFADSVVIDMVCNLGRTSDLKETMEQSGITPVGHTMKPDKLDAFDRYIEQNSEYLMSVRTAEDIRTAKATGKLGVMYYFQHGSFLGKHLKNLELFKERGVKVIQLAYDTNQIGGGGRDDATKLTEFGVEVVRRMNELGLAIDLSHCGKRTTLQAIELSEDPVTCNHANAIAMTPHWRNKSDDEIKALAAKGGVIGCMPLRRFAALRGSRSPGIDDYVAHIDYIVNLVGIDHVGFSIDGYMNGDAAYPRKDAMDEYLNSMARWKFVVLKLMKMGYAREDLQKIMGGNFLRVYERVLR